MELDMLGQCEDGVFVLELKVDRSAERNAFSELFAYSNYVAGMFALSGHRDVANVLVANLDAKITRQAFLYDLLIADRKIIVYQPEFPLGTADSLRLKLHIPSDEEFRHFSNRLMSHDAMSCVVASFHDLPDWFDSEEEAGSLNYWTKNHLGLLSSYAAQLMEAERLHGFCFVRKPWREIPRYYRNSLVICAVNPFRVVDTPRADTIAKQLEEEYRESFFELPELGFDSRLIEIAKRAVTDCLTHDNPCELETPCWSSMVTSLLEVVYTHNLAFRPTGMMREAYTSHINSIYARKASGCDDGEDVSKLKVNEIMNWLGAWTFMEACGFADAESP
jgi:hypothetical protein